jgi:hypothetical protein
MSGHFEGFSSGLGCDSNFLSKRVGRQTILHSELLLARILAHSLLSHTTWYSTESVHRHRKTSLGSFVVYVRTSRFAFHVDLLLYLPPFRPTREEATRLLSNLRVYSCSSGRTYEERSNKEPIAGQQENEEKIMGCCRRRRAPSLAPRRPRDDFVGGGGDSSSVCRSLPLVSASFIIQRPS